MIGLLIVTHCDLGKEFLNAAEFIVGSVQASASISITQTSDSEEIHKLIAEKTDEQFDLVFNTKVEGLRSLLSATKDDPISMICLFSSTMARSPFTEWRRPVITGLLLTISNSYSRSFLLVRSGLAKYVFNESMMFL